MSIESPDTDRNVTAFFDTREVAEQTISKLVETGLARDKILLRVGAARKAAFVEDGKGLLQEVKELILPSEEPDATVASLKHEGFILSVRPGADAHDAVFKVLEEQGGKGVESREDIWPDWKTGQGPSTTDGDIEDPELDPLDEDQGQADENPPVEHHDPHGGAEPDPNATARPEHQPAP